MKKSILINIISSLIVIILVVIGFKIYGNKIKSDNNIQTYALSTYNLDITNFSYINSIITDNKVYLLYNKNNYYLVRELDILANKESTYSYSVDGKCKLQNDTNYPYIYCSNGDIISIYDTKFNKILDQEIASNYNYAINTSDTQLDFKIVDYNNSYEYNNGNYQRTSNEYVSLETPYVIDAYCKDDCLLLRYNNITESTSLYKNAELLESNILAYQKYVNGIYTYTNSKIKIYDIKNDKYKEFNSPINLSAEKFTIGNNDYLYVLNDNIINVYNLHNYQNIVNIDAFRVTEEIDELLINNNYLYLYGTNTLYVYNIKDLEDIAILSYYEENLITNLVNYYQNNYDVTINLFTNPTYLTNNYNITTTYNYNELITALTDLEKYFAVFNKEFFQKLSASSKDGLEIYLVDSITPTNNRTTANIAVVGLYVNTGDKYNIILSTNDIENITTIAFHETMHVIEDYLNSKGITFSSWDNLNPADFTYSNVYYTNQEFIDTLDNTKYYSAIYFVDNYARSNAHEDRARMFEYLCLGEDFNEYPHLNDKINYIKDIILSYFPELYSSSYFI